MDDIHARFLQAVAWHQSGDLIRARNEYEEIIRLRPTHADALHLLGVTLAQSKEPWRAVDLMSQAVAIDAGNAAAHGNLGSALHSLGRREAALASYERALAIQPDFADAHFNRGNLLRELDRWNDALASYDRAIGAKADFVQAHFFRGDVLYKLQLLEESLASYDAALALHPSLAEAYSNRGNVLRILRRHDAALASYDRAIELKPNWPEAHFNRGVALNELRRVDEALACYDRAIELNADFAEARFNRSLLWLLKGDFARGWAEHEWRWKNTFGSNINERRSLTAPLWLGAEPLNGRDILLFAEQGFGDTLQFCRYAKLVAQRGARVMLEVPAPLAGLLTGLEGVSQLVIRGSALPPFDYQCPLMSLPLALGTTTDSIPSPVPYLRNDAVKVARWQGALGPKRRPRIGLAWSGSPIQPNDRNRSFLLDAMIPWLPAGFDYVSLQKDVREADRRTLDSHPQIRDLAEDLHDFSDTAAVCECMDLVISVCTSVAHLSGALGRRTWVLLTYAADWRWLLEREDSPWYPTIRLYRQPASGDWRAVFERVATDLQQTFRAS